MTLKAEQWVTVPQFLRENQGKIDRNLLYRLINEGSIPSVKLGTKKLLIPSNAFDLLAEAQATA
jgi:hypothetical protein